MSGLARIYLQRGFVVSGSDACCDSAVIHQLRAAGCTIAPAEGGDVLPGVDRVVHSLAVPPTDATLVAARQAGVKTQLYAEALGELSRERETVAIAGTHGKTTTTSMLVKILEVAERGAGHVVGAGLEGGLAAGAHWGKDGAPFVVEACEYGGSFQRLDPRGAVLINVEPDHLDFYGSFDAVKRAFADFAGRVPEDGFLIVSAACAEVLDLARGRVARTRIVGLPGTPNDGGSCDVMATDLRLVEGRWCFRIAAREGTSEETTLDVPGLHNVGNALLAAAAALELGVPLSHCVDGLSLYRGAERRFQVMYDGGGSVVIDDYAHHPTEVAATLAAVRERYPEHRLVVCYQPHQASRTRELHDEFVEVLITAHHCVLPEIYYARDSDADRATVSSRSLVDALTSRGGSASFAADFVTAREFMLEQNVTPIVYLVMGAGDVFRVAQGLVRVLSRRGPA